MRRYRKRKKKLKTFSFMILTVVLIIFIYFISVVFVGDDEVFLDVGSKYNSKIKVYSFFKNVSNSVKINGVIDNKKLGNYILNYSYRSFFGLKKSKKVKVTVVDREAPVITLTGANSVEVFLDDKYTDLGYKALDNYDGEVEVIVTGEVDTSKIGNYYLVYKAEDASHNKSEVVRKVSVFRKSPLSLSVKDFNLDDYFEGTIMKKTDKMDAEYLNNMVLGGDSVFWQFGLNNVFPSSRVWAKPCEGPYNFNSQKVYVNNAQSDYTLAYLITKNKPKYLTLHMGVCDTNGDNVDSFIKAYDKVIDYIRENSPDTKLIVMSLMPQTEEYLSWIPLRNNTKLNKYNYYLAELCEKKNVKFLNAATVVKNKNGVGDANLFFDDGYHPNVIGMKKILEYMNNHGYLE